MKAVEHLYTYLSQEIPQSTARLIFPITSLVSLSVLSLILTYRYIIHRRQKHMDANLKQDQDSWLQSALMEKGDSSFQHFHPASACDILRPLSQTSSCPTSGALAAMALGSQSESLKSTSNSTVPPLLTLEDGGSVHRSDKSVEQMSDEDSEGVRTWKRVVIEYR